MLLNRWLTLVTFACTSLLAWPCLADEPKRVVVMEFEGQGAGAVRAQVVKALSDQAEVEMVPAREVESAAKRLSVSTADPEGLRAVAGELRVSAYIEGDVARQGKGFRARVRVRNAESGAVVHEEPFDRKNKAQLATIRSKFWPVMGPHILATSAPAAKPAGGSAPEQAAVVAASEQSEQAEPAAGEADDDKTSPAQGARSPALVAWLGPRLMWRTLSYDGDTSLSGYTNEGSSPGVLAAVGAQWFPGAHFRNDWLSNVGLDFAFDYAFGLSSKQGNKELATTAYELGIGALARIPLDTFEPRFQVGYVRQAFEVEKAPLLPGVTYSALRLGAGTLVHVIEALSLDVGLAYLYALDTGELGTSSFAGNASASAVEAGAGITGRFKKVYGVRFGVDFRRYFLDFGKPTNAALTLPKSGSDDYLRMTFAFVYSLPGGSN